ncbi:helix-turn-helix domain-containing protein [Chitinophaga sp. Cy-1792]|uniref:helix-turn-helix domain-containing protein n=1 Tax=Chitinophaga sp. Cy-1792 TaxID=2608339 RepID=UPI00141DE319|nr:helix-turn-helix transcriptional regulator [Chitinophaga sp. Cy-1792]NIG53068.1 helix-turn-helix transcriptional regulator [Chitinophaga sp. Cy-1792]
MEKNEHIKKSFGANLKRIRKEKEMTQVAVAFEAELEPSYMTRLENGKADPSLSTIMALAGALEVDPCELITF